MNYIFFEKLNDDYLPLFQPRLIKKYLQIKYTFAHGFYGPLISNLFFQLN